MSRRQPPNITTPRARAAIGIANLQSRLIRDLRNLIWVETLKETQGLHTIELRICGFDTQKEPIARSERKPRRMEDRVIRHGQSIERQHPQNRSYSRKEHRHIECDHDKCGPGMVGFAAHVEGI